MEARRALWVFSLVIIFTMISDRIIFVIFPNFLLDKQFTATQIGLVFSFAALMLVISKSLIGRVSDRIGRKRIMSAGLLADSLATSAYPAANQLYEFAVINGVEQSAYTLSDSVQDAIIADTFPEKERPKALAKLGAMTPLGRAMAAVIGILVVTYLSVVWGFYAAAIALFLAFLVFAIFFHEEKPKKTGPKKKPGFHAKFPRRFKIIIAIWFLVSVNYTAAYLPAFFILARNLGISEAELFMLLLATYLLSAVLAWKSGKWIERHGREKTVLVTLFGYAILSLTYMFAFSTVSFFLILAGVGAFYYVWRIAFKTVMMDSTDPQVRGEQIGFAKTFQGLGDMAGPAIAGFLIDSISLSAAFIFAGIAGLAGAGLAVFLLLRKQPI
jgi:DHA1 family multidrug resistance protein-like MFS transporter